MRNFAGADGRSRVVGATAITPPNARDAAFVHVDGGEGEGYGAEASGCLPAVVRGLSYGTFGCGAYAGDATDDIGRTGFIFG